MQNQKAIQNKLLKGYKKSLRPIFNQDLPVTVDIQFIFRKMHHYDVVSGLFEFTGGFDYPGGISHLRGTLRNTEMQLPPDFR